MKTKIIGATILGVAIIAGILLYRQKDSNSTGGGSQSTNDPALETVPMNSGRANAQVHSVSTSFGADVTNTTTNLPNNTQPSDIVDAYSAQLHQPIAFYGRVVDQNNAAIVGANVKFIWTHFVNPETSYEKNVLTDINGGFSLQGVVGATLSVQVSATNCYPMANSSTRTFSYSKTPIQKPFQPDPGNPVVFQLRRKGIGATLITSGSGALSEYSITLPRDGTPVKVDLLQQQVSDAGQIQISQIKPAFKDWKQASQWDFKMTIPNGGFIEESDEFPFEAPASGYQQTIEFRFQQGQADWATSVKKDYYIEFGNPPKFGHLHVVTAIDIDDVRLTYQINPDGSQNLEPEN
jgi:hypothetical protein